MARDTAGFTWPPGTEDKAEGERGWVWVGAAGMISPPSLERLSHLRGAAEGERPPGRCRVLLRMLTSEEAE